MNDSGLFPTISPFILVYMRRQLVVYQSRKETLFTTFYDRRKQHLSKKDNII